MAEEISSPIKVGTPTKHTGNATPPTLTTPSGGRIYNPFQEGYLEKLGDVTVTPGIFSSDLRGVGGLRTPGRSHLAPPVPFVWSPEIQGDLFPTEIDENPTLQLKLQQMIDADADAIAQSKITSFFQSHIIAPSPDAIPKSRSNSVTPNGKIYGRDDAKAIMMTDVETQTSISIESHVDLIDLLQKAMLLGKETESGKPGGTDVASNGLAISLKECSSSHTKKPYPHSSLFLCVACQQRHPLNRYCRRSLFVEATAMETISDVQNSSEDISNPSGDASQHCPCHHHHHHYHHHHHSAQNEDPDSMAADLGLPVSWAVESVCPADASMADLSGQQPFHQRSATDLTALFDRADITPIKNLSMCLETSRRMEAVSPVAAGRTSPESSSCFQLNLSPICMPRHSDVDAEEDESTRDPFDLSGRPLMPRHKVMISPQLSPILPSNETHFRMDDGFD